MKKIVITLLCTLCLVCGFVVNYVNAEELTSETVVNIKDIDEPKIILFSPGSQSYDHYNNFEERGEHFNRLINKYWHN